MRKLICVTTVCFMIITIFSGCTVLQKLGLQQRNDDELTPVSSIVMNQDEAQKLTDKVPIHLYFLTSDSTKLKLEVRYIPVSEAKKSPSNLASVILKELINGPSANTGLKRSIPEGTKLLKQVSINNSVATVDLSKEFIDKHPGGKSAEQLTIYSIVNSLTEMKEIQKVKFTIDGKVQSEFKGNFKFDAAFPRNPVLISKESKATSADTTNIKSDTKQQDTAKDKTSDTKQQDTAKDRTSDTKQQDTAKDKTSDTKQQNTKGSDAKSTSGDAADTSTDNNGDAEATYLDNLE